MPSQNTTYTASFAIDQHTLTVISSNTNYGTVSGGGTYNYNTKVTITATPKTGYHFSKWSDNNTNASRQVTVTGNATYSASFAANQYTLTVNSNNTNYGTVSGGGIYNYNTKATLTATPKTGYHFVKWNDNNTNASRQITVTANATYTATFAINTYTLTVNSNSTSYGTVSGGGTYNHGATATLTATRTTSNCTVDFLQWSDGVKDNPRTVTVTAAATYTAQFGTLSGNCGASGNNLTWSFNRCTGVLTISGSGAMADWSAEADVPWYNYRTNITSVVLPVGLTSIGAYAFYGCAITKIDIPAAVRNFGKKAFFSSSLREICIPEGVTTLPDSLFGGHTTTTAPLERIYLPSTLTSMYDIGLAYTRLQTLTIPKSVAGYNIVIHWRYNYAPKTIYASWTENVPRRGGRLESAYPSLSKMHVPYGTTSLYTGGSDYHWSRVCGIVEDVDERAIDLGLSIRWASCNIGATAPEENGDFYAWGDTLTRSSFTWGTYPYSGTTTNTMTKYCTRSENGTVDNRSTLIAFDDAAYINWGETWRMPTWAEWNELITQCTWKDTMYNDVPVWQVTGPNGNSIYLPKVGYKNNSSVTAGCYYWSSTLNTANSNDQCNRALYINAADRSGTKYGLRYVGMPVRAVYRREWPSFTLTITDTPDGTTYTKAVNAGSSYTLTAQEDACCPFVRWSDGNTDNPRTVTVTEDATYTAVYDRSNYISGTCGAQGNNVRWTLCDGVLTITGTGAMADYTDTDAPWYSHSSDITSVIIGEGITTIGNYAFYQFNSLSSVTVPSTLTSIGSHAFHNCGVLLSITIPDGVATIGEEAFMFCSNLTSITIPNSVTTLGNNVFRFCNKISNIYVSWETEVHAWHNLTSKSPQSGITLHVPCSAMDLYNSTSGWKNYTIEGEYTASGTCGAEGDNLTWTLCDGTLTISGTGAMANYPALNMPWKDYRTSITSVIISEGVTTIGAHAFSGCSHLTSLTVPPSITSVGNYAFYECWAMESVYISDLEAWCNIDFGTYDSSPFCRNGYLNYVGGGDLYVNGTKVTTLTIPDGITEIKHHAFYGFAGITSIDFNQVTSIGNEAFNGCHGLSEVTIPEGVTAIGQYGFAYCSHLQSISIPASVSSLGTSMLAANNMLTDIYVQWTENIPAWPDNFTKKNPQSSITLHIPCAAIELYQDADGWKDYTPESEGGPFTITVTTDDASMGDVSITVP